MKITRIIASTLLALPFLFFGGIYFIHASALPPANGQPGFEMLHLMRDNGLSIAVALAHLVTELCCWFHAPASSEQSFSCR